MGSVAKLDDHVINRLTNRSSKSSSRIRRVLVEPVCLPSATTARQEERQQAIISGDRNPARDGHCRSCRRVRWGVRDCSVTNLGYGAMESGGTSNLGPAGLIEDAEQSRS
jgi:hypothetical protein